MLKKFIPDPRIRSAVEWTLALAVAALLFLALRGWVFRTANVTGNSMEPTLNHGDWVLLSRIHYVFTNPQPGQIVAFPYKENPSEYYIKRIVGVPGDIIDLRNYRFYVNGVLLEDDFSEESISALGDIHFPLTVEEGHYFVLGDNRNGSKDSRYRSVGCIPKSQMVGVVTLRVWPLNAIGTVR